MKRAKDQVLIDAVWNFIKNKVNQKFGFSIDLHLLLSSFTYYVWESVGGAKQAVM